VREIRLLGAVFEDMAQATRWYDVEGSIELGDRFTAVFYSYLTHIQQHEKAYSVVYKEFRRVLLKPFPYSLYYRNYEDWIVVALVIHAARSPRSWQALLRGRGADL